LRHAHCRRVHEGRSREEEGVGEDRRIEIVSTR
jgi:hypothetical protein